MSLPGSLPRKLRIVTLSYTWEMLRHNGEDVNMDKQAGVRLQVMRNFKTRLPLIS